MQLSFYRLDGGKRIREACANLSLIPFQQFIDMDLSMKILQLLLNNNKTESESDHQRLRCQGQNRSRLFPGMDKYLGSISVHNGYILVFKWRILVINSFFTNLIQNILSYFVHIVLFISSIYIYIYIYPTKNYSSCTYTHD